MGRLIDSFKAYITDDATAEASDLAEGKTAYVNGGKVTGPSKPNGLLYLHMAPTSSAEVQPYLPEATYISPTIGTFSKNTFTLTNGLWVPGSSDDSVILNTGGAIPARTTSHRYYKMWGENNDVAPSSTEGARIITNYSDGNNYWLCQFYWQGSYFFPHIVEVTGGTSTQRDNGSISTNVDWPTAWSMEVWEGQYEIAFSFMIWEKDNPIDSAAAGMSYYNAGGRPNYTNTGLIMGVAAIANCIPSIRGVMIMDW